MGFERIDGGYAETRRGTDRSSREMIMDHSLFAHIPGIKLPQRSKGRGAVAAVEWAPIPDGAILLALDPSVVACGWACIRKINRNRCERIISGVWKPKAKGEATRFNVLADLAKRVCEVDHVTDAVIELPNKGPAWKMSADDIRANSRAIGALEAACYFAGACVALVRVSEWKGRGKKQETRMVVKALFGYDATEHNECDALGLGAWMCGR